MEDSLGVTNHTVKRMRSIAKVLVVIWAGWILIEQLVPILADLVRGDLDESLFILAGLWLIFLVSAIIPWRWEAIGSMMLLLGGAFLLLLGVVDIFLLPKAWLPLVAGFLFFTSSRAETPEGIDRVTLFRMVFKIAGHLFILAGMFLIATKGRSSYIHIITIASALLGYFNVLCIIQAVFYNLRRGLSFPRILLAIAYLISGLPVVLFVGSISSFFMGPTDELKDYIGVIATALTGLISAVSGIIAQMTVRKKTIAEVEVERQKLALEHEKLQSELALEREKLQLEREKLSSSAQRAENGEATND